MQITWFGRVVVNEKKKSDSDQNSSFPAPTRIEWTKGEMVVGLSRDDPTAQIIPNPPAAERLRTIPWDILITEDDGMLLLRRGQVGVLVYDLL